MNCIDLRFSSETAVLRARTIRRIGTALDLAMTTFTTVGGQDILDWLLLSLEHRSRSPYASGYWRGPKAVPNPDSSRVSEEWQAVRIVGGKGVQFQWKWEALRISPRRLPYSTKIPLSSSNCESFEGRRHKK